MEYIEEKISKNLIIDYSRLEQEQNSYESWLEEHTEAVYQIAAEAKSKKLDFENVVEIPRASDLASRTEKLLEDYLDGMKIEEDLRHLLNTTDRESASIQIAVDVARKMNEQTLDMQKSIDCGLRVGLAVLTEAVLVAPLDGIGDVRILNNADGTEFLSIEIPYFFLIVPSSASFGLVAPIKSLFRNTAFSFSSIITTIGPDDKYAHKSL